MTKVELLGRAISVIMLCLITSEIFALNRLLHSFAWRLLAAGHAVFLVLLTVMLVWQVSMTVRIGVSILGYALIAYALHKLYHDVWNLRRRTGIRKLSGETDGKMDD